MADCQAEGCDRRAIARGYCDKHYRRLRRRGTVVAVGLRDPIEDRYHRKVDRRGPDECWPWLAGLTSDGYGQFMHPAGDGKRCPLAHRFGWGLRNGAIPDGMVIDHTCHDPRTCAGGATCPHRQCQNPAHWALVPPTANNTVGRQRTYAHRTHCSQGHEYTPENTRVYLRGGTPRRVCLTCAAAYRQAYEARKAAEG